MAGGRCHVSSGGFVNVLLPHMSRVSSRKSSLRHVATSKRVRGGLVVSTITNIEMKHDLQYNFAIGRSNK